MIVCVNGHFVSEEQAVVSVFDRGFLYGDGVFETIPIFSRRPFRWAAHIERLARGIEFLGIQARISDGQLKTIRDELIRRNSMSDAVLRITVSRGVGTRGYSTKGANEPTQVMSLHPLPGIDFANPQLWRLMTSSLRVNAGDPLSRIKSCNKLTQILARTEAGRKGVDEGLLLNTHGEIAETTSANLFWLKGGTLCTPPIKSGALPGITRSVVMELGEARGVMIQESSATLDVLKRADGVFATLSTLGVVECVNLDDAPLHRSSVVKTLRNAYWELVAHETQIS